VTDDNDAGLYGPSSEAWRLNREAMLLLGAGPRALLMQIAHPAVAAGVDEHSNFRADPWRRLAATLRSYLTIVYGTSRVARAEIRRLNTLHRGIVGVGYAARDPELSLWVHATLVDSTMVVNDAWIEPMPRARRAAFYLETRPIGRAFGVPDRLLPEELDAFDSYVQGMMAPSGPVQVSPLARELAGVILHPPLAPLAQWFSAGTPPTAARAGLPAVLARVPATAFSRVSAAFGRVPAAALARVPAAAYDWTLWPAVGLLPKRVRLGYELPWGTREEFVSRWLVGVWRASRPWLPVSLRQMPQALAADYRIRTGGPSGPDLARLARSDR
jgi:uncharacterized protein (DUF2236 family)